jgi:hypothetical protein
MDTLERHVVNGGLGFAQPSKEVNRPVLARARQVRAFDELGDLLETVMGVRVVTLPIATMLVCRLMLVPVLADLRTPVALIVGVAVRDRLPALDVLARMPADARAGRHDAKFGRRNARSENALRGDPTVVDGQAAERRAQTIERQTQVEGGAEHHIARHAREAIEV